jgi:hypothetical protein
MIPAGHICVSRLWGLDVIFQKVYRGHSAKKRSGLSWVEVTKQLVYKCFWMFGSDTHTRKNEYVENEE